MGNSSSRSWLKALELTAPIGKNPKLTLPVAMEQLAQKFDVTTAFISGSKAVSYLTFNEQCNHYSRWALACNLVRGDVVCLFMNNCSDYFAIWLGITRIGAIVSLINSNLRGQLLVHSIALVSPRYVIAGEGLAQPLSDVCSELPTEVECWAHGTTEGGFPRVDEHTTRIVGRSIEDAFRPSISDTALFIYTSGTTGLPKAATISHFKLMQWSYWFAGLMDTNPGDRMYNCLPMYHSVGGVVAIGATLVGGGSVFIRERFSASEFWTDIVESDCTLFQYIGEMCRYLVKGPRSQLETNHKIRLCCGNGLSESVWRPFQGRFKIPRILEFYASTEGNVSLYNCEGEPGAIGRIPRYLAHRFPMELVRCDLETGEPLRGSDGFCQRCSTNESGHAIGRIGDVSASYLGRFDGYTDRSASNQKVLKNVFDQGDSWYLTGDLMRRNKDGFYFFVDRVGDAFRWKGENVSATEVGNVVGSCEGVIEAVVYGVEVPEAEGRAGMASILAGPRFSLAVLHEFLAGKLPSYARPLFVRISTRIEQTETFKPRRHTLKLEGFDPSSTTDAIYFNDSASATFLPLDADLHQRICNGSIRI